MNRINDKNIIQQYGFYHSGTGYIALLLHKNFKDLMILRCKKHDGPTSLEHGEMYCHKDFALENYYYNDFIIDNNNKGLTGEEINSLNMRIDIKYIIVIKNPYVWCMRQMERHPNRPISVSIGNWNRANKRYYQFWKERHHDTDCIIINYESLLNSFEMMMHKIEDVLHLETRSESFENIDEFSNDLHEGRKPEKKDFLEEWHKVNERVISDKTIISQINNCVDKQVMNWFGYEVR